MSTKAAPIERAALRRSSGETEESPRFIGGLSGGDSCGTGPFGCGVTATSGAALGVALLFGAAFGQATAFALAATFAWAFAFALARAAFAFGVAFGAMVGVHAGVGELKVSPESLESPTNCSGERKHGVEWETQRSQQLCYR